MVTGYGGLVRTARWWSRRVSRWVSGCGRGGLWGMGMRWCWWRARRGLWVVRRWRGWRLVRGCGCTGRTVMWVCRPWRRGWRPRSVWWSGVHRWSGGGTAGMRSHRVAGFVPAEHDGMAFFANPPTRTGQLVVHGFTPGQRDTLAGMLPAGIGVTLDAGFWLQLEAAAVHQR